MEKKTVTARRKQLREFLRRREKLIIPGVFDPLSARIVKGLGFQALYLGGWSCGAHLATPEPLLTLTEQIHVASWIVKTVDLPLIQDGDAGFGDVLHTTRAVQEFEHAGVTGIHLEDQVFPKRASYHKGLEHIVPLEEFEEKISYALSARQDPNFIIIGRTDAGRAVEGSYEEVVRRCRALIRLGVDALLPFPWGSPPPDFVRKFRQDVPDDIPVFCLGGLNEFSAQDWWDMGYHMILYALTDALMSARAIQQEYKALKETGKVTLSPADLLTLRLGIQDIIGLSDYYEIEAKTTEKKE